MKIIYDETHRLHAPISEFSGSELTPYPECPDRAEGILAALRRSDWAEVVPPQVCAIEKLSSIHPFDYLRFLQQVHDSWLGTGQSGDLAPSVFARPRHARAPIAPYAQAGYYGFDTTPITSGTWAAACASSYCALTGADLLLAGERVAYSLCRPPGHHAGRSYYGGYCYLNNAALAAQHLSADGRVAVLDIDYHHGNGTQDIFYESSQVFFCSLHADPAHQYPLYWGYADECGAGEGEGFNCNIPLPASTDDQRYLSALEQGLARIADFAPDYLVVSAGLDIYAGDPLGDFAITLVGFTAIGQRLRECPWPVLVVQEGGYNLDHLGEVAARLLGPLAH